MTQSNISKFKRYLNKHGAVILDPTNEWELVRFKTDDGTISVMYGNSKGKPPKFTGYAREAYNAFVTKRPWKAVSRERRQLTKRKSDLAERDGKRCFACLKPYDLGDLTIEHLLSFSHGGTDNENNLCLLDEEHNKLLGNLPVVEKIRLIMELREQSRPKETVEVENIWDREHTQNLLIGIGILTLAYGFGMFIIWVIGLFK